MIVMNVNDRKDTKIETFPYKGKPLEVKNVWIRWLSQAGPEGFAGIRSPVLHHWPGWQNPDPQSFLYSDDVYP